MKPSYTEERRHRPSTDRKFEPTDDHIVEENKEEVAKDAQGDKLEPLVRQHPNNSKKSK